MKIFSRALIVFGWVFLIAIIFYFPSWKDAIVPQADRSINVFAWGDTLDTEILSEFEKKTGIKINLSFFSSNEELLVKMKATSGYGYDLIIPSDYAISALIKEELLQPLDRSKFLYWEDIYPALLDHKFDPGNRYSIPFEWEVYGFGVNQNFFQNRPIKTWDAIFDPPIKDYKIAMINAPLEVFNFAANYLFGPIDSVTDAQYDQVSDLLMRQRKWVVAYSDFRADYYLATGNCPLALTTSAYIKRIRPLFPQISFVLPEDGSVMTIENFCLSKTSEKADYAYALLNFLYTKKSQLAHYKTFLYYPASKEILDDMNLPPEERALYEMSRQEIEKFRFFQNIVSQQKVRDLWVEVKSF